MNRISTTLILVFAMSFAGAAPSTEELFWDCDYTAMKTMLGADEAAECSAAFEKIKAEKFKGDFAKMMEWWRKNKTFEHSKRKSGSSAS